MRYILGWIGTSLRAASPYFVGRLPIVHRAGTHGSFRGCILVHSLFANGRPLHVYL